MALPFSGVPFAMRSPTLVFVASFCGISLSMRAADATSPVDASQRNAPFAPTATMVPEKQVPAAKTNPGVQDRRFETTTVEKQTSPLSGQRAAIDVRETRDKTVREKVSHRPEASERILSDYNHRPAAIGTGTDAAKPPMVAKYQDRLTAASATNMARFPALDRATTAKINRFVFRKNPTEAQAAMEGAAVTPAAGGSPIRK